MRDNENDKFNLNYFLFLLKMRAHLNIYLIVNFIHAKLNENWFS
jgi:hypothetical protein